MIGKVIFTTGGNQIEAVLEDNGQWSCPDEIVEGMLISVFSCDNYSVADGRFGWAQLNGAAEMLDGSVEGIEEDPETDDLVY